MIKKFQTPPLPYAYEALEPIIDAETMHVHHDKHHAAYTMKFNAALEKYPEWFGKDPEEILSNLEAVPEDIRLAVRNHGGGYVNHSMYWSIMEPKAGGVPTGNLLAAIEEHFGTFPQFQAAFEEAAMMQFGSGWAWLTYSDGKLWIEKSSNQDTPLSQNRKPLLCLDVWEHAYYLKYKNLRLDYVKAFWKVVNWHAVGERLRRAT